MSLFNHDSFCFVFLQKQFLIQISLTLPKPITLMLTENHSIYMQCLDFIPMHSMSSDKLRHVLRYYRSHLLNLQQIILRCTIYGKYSKIKTFFMGLNIYFIYVLPEVLLYRYTGGGGIISNAPKHWKCNFDLQCTTIQIVPLRQYISYDSIVKFIISHS